MRGYLFYSYCHVASLYLLLIVILVYLELATATRCYSCHNFETSEDCQNVTNCGSHEVCFARADGLSTGKVQYTVGCSRVMTAVLEDSTFCSEVCTENFCNLNKCNIPVSPKGTSDRSSRCLSCALIRDPANCFNLVQCKPNEICYVRELTVYGNKRYRLGCINKHHCSTETGKVTTNPITIIGKRLAAPVNSSVPPPCSLCCELDHCNTRACLQNQQSLVGMTQQINLIGGENDTCMDTNIDACSAFGTLDSEACLTLPKVDEMCPKTCEICGHFGWSSWSQWSQCSHTCNEGTVARNRQCIHQIDIANAHNCIGNSTETMACNNGPCLIEGSWSDWESWGLCSRTCLNGTRNRLRHCRSTDQDQGGLYCPGNHLETSTCNQITCPVEKTCPDNWIVYHLSCYFFDHTATTFANAQRFCHARNSSMVHIESVDENTFIVSHLQTFSNPGNGWWIGMTDSDVEGTWKWTDTNELVNYTNWDRSEPNDSGVGEDCAVLLRAGGFRWNDYSCLPGNDLYSVICMR